MEQIIAAIIGGFLAAGTGWLLEGRKEQLRLQKSKKLLTTSICDDLNHSLSLYDKVQEEWDKTKIIWFSTLNELKESRQTYINNKDWIVIFEEEKIRKRIFQYYLRSAEVISLLEFRQKRKYELENKYNDLVRDIKFKDPSLSDEDVRKNALSYMASESAEYDNLLVIIPETVTKLGRFKAEAESLHAMLSS